MEPVTRIQVLLSQGSKFRHHPSMYLWMVAFLSKDSPPVFFAKSFLRASVGISFYLTQVRPRSNQKRNIVCFFGKLGPPQPQHARHFCTPQQVAEQWQPVECDNSN